MNELTKSLNDLQIEKKEASKRYQKEWRRKNMEKSRLTAIVNNSRVADRGKRPTLFDAKTHVDTKFIRQLIVEQKSKCIYCHIDVRLKNINGSRANLASLERINNTLCHTKTNCVIACYPCNMSRNSKFTFEGFKEMKIKVKEARQKEHESKEACQNQKIVIKEEHQY
jgi:hypothetical protein